MPETGPDYLQIERLLTDDERSIRNLVAEFVAAEVAPSIGRHWQEGTFPMALVAQMGELGIFGPTLPKEYGGAGISDVAYGLIMQELERGDSGLRSFASVQSALSMYAIWRFGSEAQRRRWLPKMAKGQAIGCFGLTEPDAGSDPGAMTTRAQRDGGGWVLNGVKRWITNGTLADVAVVWAREEGGAILGFLVERGTEGFSAEDVHTKASMRASHTSDLMLDTVRLSDDARLPEAKGLGAPLACLTQARFGIACGVVGAAMDCFNEALAYTGQRIAFGHPIAGTQLVQEHLVDMLSRLTAAQLTALQLGRLKEAGELRYAQVSLAKRNNTRAALEVARIGRELLGGNGITTEYRAIRHMANLETVDTYEGTYEIHTLIVGRDLTGLDAFRAPGAAERN